MEEEMEGLTMVIGMMVGASTALILLTIISCVCCPWCPNYSKKEMDKFKGNSLRIKTVQRCYSALHRNYVPPATPRQL